MPAIGLGTFRLKGQETIDLAVSTALKQGYRHIDTAAVYRNEGQIAETLEKLQISCMIKDDRYKSHREKLSSCEINYLIFQ